jgi:hypothetical protein
MPFAFTCMCSSFSLVTVTLVAAPVAKIIFDQFPARWQQCCCLMPVPLCRSHHQWMLHSNGLKEARIPVRGDTQLCLRELVNKDERACEK